MMRWLLVVQTGLWAAAACAQAAAQGSPPAAPSDLVGRPLSGTEIRISWVDHSSNETGFGLWRRSSQEEWRRIAVLPPNRTTYVDGGLTRHTAYSYRLRAHNNSGASDWSEVSQVTTPAVPAPPRHLAAGVLSGTQVSLTWFHLGIGATGIGIWRKVSGGDWVRVGVAGPSVSIYLDDGLLPDTLYEYRVRAHNNEGASEWSNVALCVTASTLWIRHFAPDVRSRGSRTRVDFSFSLPASFVAPGAATVRAVGPRLEAITHLPAVVTHLEPIGRGYGFLNTGAYRPGVYLIRAEITYLMPGGAPNTVVSRWSRLIVP